ncbi:hypothetical protein [Blastococcus sp. TF02-09]|uniref:hypothetical protein n=1 Tax=Blastococcus sp. TF02-09 TaxID=2250576 RepID=UPI0011BDAD51|nr:hypothetical protein [Blastococcus sp. TF02-9]
MTVAGIAMETRRVSPFKQFPSVLMQPLSGSGKAAKARALAVRSASEAVLDALPLAGALV